MSAKRPSLPQSSSRLTPQMHYAEIITHTPEQAQRWREIARTNPNRVARTLVLQNGQRTREGDTQADLYPALQAVREISFKAARDGVDTKAWENLVNGGVADALCSSVCSTAVRLEAPLPDTPEELLIKFMNELPSPYQRPLEILCDAAVGFKSPPTKTDKKVISALKREWGDMTARIWDKPENTLRPEDSHTMERVVIAQMVVRLIVTDPTFISILYEPDDLTVQIIARHWKHSQRASDAMITASLLFMLLSPTNRNHIAYVRSHGLDSEQSKLVSKILLGVGPTVLSSKSQQVKALMTTFADHFVRLSMTARSAADQLFFFLAFVDAAKKGNAEPEVEKQVFKSTPLWNAMLRLLRKAAKPFPPPPSEQAPAAPTSSEETTTEKENRMRAIASIIGILANTMHGASQEHPRECENLVRIWANENLFGALEETVDILVELPGVTMQLTRLITVMDGVVEGGSASLKHTFAAQFPRWRVLGTLIRNDVSRQRASGGRPSFMDIPDSGLWAKMKGSNREDEFWDHGAWQVFGTMQFKRVDKTMCGKRGCENAGSIVCTCQGVQYCSEACKAKDEKDHKLVCGRVGVLQNLGVKTSVLDATPPRPGPAQTNSAKKKKKKSKAAKGDNEDEMPGLEEVD